MRIRKREAHLLFSASPWRQTKTQPVRISSAGSA